jgi:hypothetical protein
LVVLCHLWSERERWEQTGTDYPDDLGMDVTFAVGPGLTLILVLATFFPVIHPKQIRDAGCEVLDGPWAAVDQATLRMFGPLIRPGPGEVSGGGLLPRAHLLGGRPELGQEIVMYVSTDDPPPPPPEGAAPQLLGAFVPRRYWRGTTFDTYTGDGWSNGPLEAHAVPQGETLALAARSGRSCARPTSCTPAERRCSMQ